MHRQWDRSPFFCLREVVQSPSENPWSHTIESAGEKQWPPCKFVRLSPSLNWVFVYHSMGGESGRHLWSSHYKKEFRSFPLFKQGWQLFSLSLRAITPGGRVLFPLPYKTCFSSSTVVVVFYNSFHKRTLPNSTHLCTSFFKIQLIYFKKITMIKP